MSTTQTAIAQAVEPLRAAAIESAREAAAAHADRSFAKYEADPKCIECKIGEGRFERATRQALIATLREICTVKSSRFVRDADKLAAYLDLNGEKASQQYTAFVQKLEGKVGEHTAAKLEGSHVWGFSLLSVTKADGSVELWKTQQIMNVSVLGRVFPQWPSRKVKAA